MTRRGLIHGHTYHSFDGLVPPEAYLWYAARHHLDFLCITDHNTLAGSLQAARANRNPALEVVIGAEYCTDRGDVIGLFLSEEITTRKWDETLNAIHDQGGLALLPHPYKGHDLCDELWQAVDLVETFNARTDAPSNEAAGRSATAFQKATYVGSDAHTLWELVNNHTLLTLEGEGPLRELLLDAPRLFSTRRQSRLLHKYSQVVKRIKHRMGFPGHR